MKKYEGITPSIYRLWDLEKFQARPARRRGGLDERKDMKHVNSEQCTSVASISIWHFKIIEEFLLL